MHSKRDNFFGSCDRKAQKDLYRLVDCVSHRSSFDATNRSEQREDIHFFQENICLDKAVQALHRQVGTEIFIQTCTNEEWHFPRPVLAV